MPSWWMPLSCAKALAPTIALFGCTEKPVTVDSSREALVILVASMPVQYYVGEVRAGYRAPYLKELADRVSSGELNVETWLTSPLSTAELVKEIRGVKGAGPYAAENLLKLLGRYDGLALDSWTRAKFFKVRNKGRKANDKKIERYYSRFKEWRGLALWCDVTRDWLD